MSRLVALFSPLTGHRRTDPICRYHRAPLTRWGDRRARGRTCLVCIIGWDQSAEDWTW